MDIDFENKDLNILLNPRIGPKKESFLKKILHKELNEKLTGHVLVASSGSTKKDQDDFKLIALSKKAILASAKAVNHHLNATERDVWLNVLPFFHVGGLGIDARAFLTESRVIKLAKWEPTSFFSLINTHLVTLTSLVPAQVYDLCKEKLKAPKTLRAVVVGGGALSEELYIKAKKLQWPLHLSYGLTECASQVATSDNNSSDLQLLNHMEARVDANGFLEIKSEALLSYEVVISKNNVLLQDPKKEGWLKVEDRVSLNNRYLTFMGRIDDFIKIGGEGVLFLSLQQKLEDIKLAFGIEYDAALVTRPDKRLGSVIHLAATAECKDLVDAFNSSCMPYERIRHVHHVSYIPRSPLKKLLLSDLQKLITLS